MSDVLLIVFTDGRRHCIDRAIPSIEEHLKGGIARKVIHDDSGDEDYRDWLVGKFDEYEVIWHPAGRQGFGGAYRNAWRFLTGCSESYVFSTEDDFVFNCDVDLQAMKTVLSLRPNLTQLALRRQPWNSEEMAAGGIVEQHPDDYEDMTAAMPGLKWLEHRRHFTTNSNLHRRSLCYLGWPDDPHSEGKFGISLFKDPQARSGYWGARDSGVWVTHIGTERVGVGY